MRWILALALGILAAAPVSATSIMGRFSKSLKPADVKACGIDRLSKDQIAALDDLIQRQDAVAASATAPLPPFSKRLTAEEYRAAGMDRLTEAEVVRIDDLVMLREKEFFAAARRAVPAPGPVPASPETSVVASGPTPELHGSVTVGMGWGSGGTSDRFGAVESTYTDPAHGFSIDVGVAEGSEKGRGILAPVFP